MRRQTFDDLRDGHRSIFRVPVQPWLDLVDSQPIWYVPTPQQILRRWEWLEWRFPRFVKVRPIAESAQGRPIYLGTVSREGDFSLSQRDGFLSSNGNHAVEYGGALGSAFTATGMAFSFENDCDWWGYPYHSLLCTDIDGSAENTYLGEKLSWEVFKLGRYRPPGTTYCVDYEMRPPGDTSLEQRPEARVVDDCLQTLNPSLVMSNHGQVLGMGEYAEVAGRGNLGFAPLVSAVLGEPRDLQPFSLDFPNTVPYAPGVFPAPAKGPVYDGSQGLTISERLHLKGEGYAAVFALSEPRLFQAEYIKDVFDGGGFDREQMCREGNESIARLTHPFIERVGDLPLDLDNRVHVGALGRLGRHANVLYKRWNEIVPTRPKPRDERGMQFERFALNERRVVNAMLDLADCRRVALECGHRRLAEEITTAVNLAEERLGKTVRITLRPLREVIRTYVALELALMAGNPSMNLFDFGPNVQARHERLRANELSPGLGRNASYQRAF